MRLDYIPLLGIQRQIQGMPRDRVRFGQYLRTISCEDRTDIELVPLLMMNPMGKEHVTVLLDDLLALDADGVGARAAAEAAADMAGEPGEFKAALVVVDDLKGGWTNRYDYEFSHRNWYSTNPNRFWVTGILWSSEPASAVVAREAMLTAAYRTAYIQDHGVARTLRDMIVQEGRVMARAGCTGPLLDEDEVAYTREVIAPFLDAGDMRTCVECLFGDAAARTLGFTPRGLSPRAGLALALHDARAGLAPGPAWVS
jgi:hypothetical protein